MLRSYRTRSSWLRLREPATPIPAYRKSRLKPSLRLLAPTLAPTPTTVWSALSRFYLSQTKAFCCGRKHLFISYKPGHHDEIKAPTILSWLVKTVCYVYEHTQDQTAHLYHVKGHDLRAFAASWNALQKVSTRDILRAAQWRSHKTFTAFYLVDLSVIEEDMYKIGPLVTAHHIP